MDDRKSDQSSAHNSTATSPPKPAQDPLPQAAPSSLPPHNGKRRPSDVDIQTSSYYKMRAIVRDLRPHFIEVLRTPDFQNCNGGREIKKQMKLVMDLYKQMIVEAEAADTIVDVSSSPKIMHGKESSNGHCDEKHKDLLDNLAERMHSPCSSDKKGDEEMAPGSYIVGGSVFGWNFVTFCSNRPVYYGVTKEQYRSSHPLAEVVNLQTNPAEASAEVKSPVATPTEMVTNLD